MLCYRLNSCRFLDFFLYYVVFQANAFNTSTATCSYPSYPPAPSVVTIHRCIDESRYLSRDMYRDTVCNNRDTRDLATFLRFLFECLTDINCQSAKNYQCRMSSHPQQTAGSYSQLKSIKLCRMSVISNKWSYD